MATAVVALAGGLGGYLFGSLNWGWRILFILGALTVVISPGITLMPVQLTNIVASASIVGLILLRFSMSRFRQ